MSQKYLVPSQPVTPERIHLELALLHHLTPHKLFTCLETSCAFQQWLAVHGESGRVVVGKRIENGNLIMHAWVETEHAIFFKESDFEAVEWIF